MDRRQSRARRHPAAFHAAAAHTAVLRKRRHLEDRRAKRALPAVRQLDRGSFSRSRSHRTRAVFQGCRQASPRARRLGGEARSDQCGRRREGAGSGTVDLSRLNDIAADRGFDRLATGLRNI
ncbi:hypothetical protein RHIZ404_220660 [Rhizobium sp. EC-SD404]|nr:hypothetical protein RHIZ404_220660 [Rhizobium sp. EC-SD404]